MDTEQSLAYINNLFVEKLQRVDFTRYINESLAGDFAWVLANHLKDSETVSVKNLHAQTGWQANYGSHDQGQQYRCILCGAGGASGRGSEKPLTYNCHECPGKATMWPTPQYKLYREAVDQLAEAQAEMIKLRGPEETVVICEKGKPYTFMSKDPCRYSLCEVTYAAPVRTLIAGRDALREELATVQRGKDNADLALTTQTKNKDRYKQRAEAAEQRNAELVELLCESIVNYGYGVRMVEIHRRIEAALKPTESGASE